MIRRAFVLGLLALAVVPRASLAWWDDAWSYRKPITLDTTAAGAALASGVENATVLIRLDMGNFAYFTDAKPDGSDVRFVAGDDRTPIPFHVESWDPVLGMALIWVKVPRLAAGTTDNVFMYYGNPEAVAASDPAASFDVNQVLVYHFDGLPPVDRTAYGNDPVAATVAENAASVIGRGVAFDGTGRIDVPASASLRLVPAQGLTVSAWIRIDGPQADAVVVEGIDPTGAGIALAVDGFTPYLQVRADGSALETGRRDALASNVLTAGSWYLLTAVFAADRSLLYLDGRQIGEIAAPLPDIAGDFAVGSAAAGGRALVGALDELGIANVARSAERVKLAFASQGQQATLVRYGEDAAREAGEGQSYMLVTLQNVTLDGWIVIALLTVMSMASWIIMISKGITISRVRRDNGRFIRAFRSQANRDVSSLDREDDDPVDDNPFADDLSGDYEHEYKQYPNSTLYHLYHTGVQEVRRRLAGATLSAARADVLGETSMDAIRATLDAANVRETQKLNSQMVLLTLAIAGGPFLGLLGTVVGVMITFAAIAATGDVNVNSIAPGIAAALVATVAGLAVAIPALFGYNYLASRIKEVVADDRVFVDEFVTRIAERYG